MLPPLAIPHDSFGTAVAPLSNQWIAPPIRGYFNLLTWAFQIRFYMLAESRLARSSSLHYGLRTWDRDRLSACAAVASPVGLRSRPEPTALA